MSAAIRFTNPQKTDFHRVVTQRVDRYFEENGISKYADYRMVIKTVVMYGLYFVPYFLMLFVHMPAWAMLLCCSVMGLGLSGIGMAVMHDANHGAYSKHRWVNQLLGYSLDVVGGNSGNWKIQHNQQHHTFTNIHGHDWDIRARGNLRLTPAVKKNFLHRFQVFYALFLYALQTVFWVAIKDFIQLCNYNNEPVDKLNSKQRTAAIGKLIVAKILYVLYIVVIPVMVLHPTWWQYLIGFLVMHGVAGLVLTTVFQLAHVVEDAQFPDLDEKGNIQAEWAVHQMQTTANFAANNKLVTYYVGGLNYQIEHHLFQRICHIHYPKIAPIVKQTAQEYGIPYLNNETLTDAIVSHLRLLNQLGVKETLHMATEF